MTDEQEIKKKITAEQVAGRVLAFAGLFFGICSAGATYMGFKDNTGFFTSLVGIPLWLTALGFGMATGACFSTGKRVMGVFLFIFVGCLTCLNGVIDDISLREVSKVREEARLAWNENIRGAAIVVERSETRLIQIDEFMQRARSEDIEIVKDAQRELKDLGYYVADALSDECTPGRTRIDGSRGGCTEEALQAWSSFNGIPDEIRSLNAAVKENAEWAKEAVIEEPSIFTAAVARLTAIIMNLLALTCTVGAGYFNKGQTEIERMIQLHNELREEMAEREEAMRDEKERLLEDMARRERNLEERIEIHKERSGSRNSRIADAMKMLKEQTDEMTKVMAKRQKD
jgi:hypothetical protein